MYLKIPKIFLNTEERFEFFSIFAIIFNAEMIYIDLF